jgi:crotonobetainyl-CoA:carnitine CoA-transferase CaiB-like acyl-CoA transferase
MTTQSAFGALAGLRVIDLTRVLGGPYCTQILGDHGAEIIKLEPPAGDETRQWAPMTKEGSAYYNGANRNKRSIGLDLTKPRGRDVLMMLLKDADVLIENFKPGTLDKWGIGNAFLREKFPKLIHCRISGFGGDGPRGGQPGYDAIVQAMAGMIAANGSPEGGPTRIGIPVVDLTTGLYAAVGILMALNERQKSGLGQFLETTLFETGLAVMHPHSSNYFFTGKTPVPQGNPHPSLAPYESFETRDGLIFIGIGNDGTFRKLCQEVGKPELGADKRFARNQDRITNREQLRAEMEEVFKHLDRDALCDRLLAAGLPAGPIQSIDKALNSEHSKHRGIVIQKDWYKGVASPIRFDRSRASLRRAPPGFSEHAKEILGEAGLTQAEVDALVAEGVVSAAEAATKAG